jgi:dTDP-4-amino-4,6-dideoxygalactose transaminase
VAGAETKPVGGFGRAEVFSLTPTKVLSGAEGGLVTTNDSDLAERLRIARNYGNPGDYDCRFPGLNARLSELHAAVALSSLRFLESRVENRNHLAGVYREGLASLGGVDFQEIPDGARSSYKDFTILVDPDGFGCDRDVLALALDAEGIETRKYYSPPVHAQQAYSTGQEAKLPVTDLLASRVLTLPMWSHLPEEAVERVVTAISRARSWAGDLAASAQTGSG